MAPVNCPSQFPPQFFAPLLFRSVLQNVPNGPILIGEDARRSMIHRLRAAVSPARQSTAPHSANNTLWTYARHLNGTAGLTTTNAPSPQPQADSVNVNSALRPLRSERQRVWDSLPIFKVGCSALCTEYSSTSNSIHSGQANVGISTARAMNAAAARRSATWHAWVNTVAR